MTDFIFRFMKNTVFGIFVILSLLNVAQNVSAALVIDNIQFDPAVIAAGDEVDIVIEYYDDIVPYDTDDRAGDSDYSFKVELEADDDLTKDYVSIVDREGNNVGGTIFAGQRYNKVFRVKVQPNAPSGSYEFKLVGQWYRNDVRLDSSRSVRFKMPVKREGIILGFANMQTEPAEVRPGDDYVKIVGALENVGEKYSKSVEVRLDPPQGIESSYTNDNRLWAGRIDPSQQKDVTFFVDIDEDMDPGLYNITYTMDYMDADDNLYTKSGTIPFRIKPRPYLEVIEAIGSTKAGQDARLEVTVKNTGEESAESVDIRIMKQNSQPFVIDVRSDYVGEIEPGETGKAVFDIKVTRDASVKEHDISLLIRAKGDSEEGDDNIYLFNRQAKLDVTGKAPNQFIVLGSIVLGVVVILGFVLSRQTKRKSHK